MRQATRLPQHAAVAPREAGPCYDPPLGDSLALPLVAYWHCVSWKRAWGGAHVVLQAVQALLAGLPSGMVSRVLESLFIAQPVRQPALVQHIAGHAHCRAATQPV